MSKKSTHDMGWPNDSGELHMTARKALAPDDSGLNSATADQTPSHELEMRNRLPKLAFLLFSLLSVALVHLPWLPVGLQAFGHAYTNLIGQEVRWTMFSSDPRGTSVDLWAEIYYSDGTQSTWVIDRSGSGGDFGFYRTVKWMEGAVLEPEPGSLTRFADYLIATSRRPVEHVEIWTSQQPGLPPDQARPPVEAEMVLSVISGESGG
jgi:hypothetical protein